MFQPTIAVEASDDEVCDVQNDVAADDVNAKVRRDLLCRDSSMNVATIVRRCRVVADKRCN